MGASSHPDAGNFLPPPYSTQSKFDSDTVYFRTVAIKLGVNYSDVDDVVQELWKKVTTYWHRFDPSKPFRPWAVQILRRIVIDQYRHTIAPCRDKRRNRSIDDQAMQQQDYRNLQTVPTFSEASTQLHECLQSLTEKCELAVRLRFFESHQLKEVAETLGIRPSAVSNLIKRAYQRLKICMKAKGFDEL